MTENPKFLHLSPDQMCRGIQGMFSISRITILLVVSLIMLVSCAPVPETVSTSTAVPELVEPSTTQPVVVSPTATSPPPTPTATTIASPTSIPPSPTVFPEIAESEGVIPHLQPGELVDITTIHMFDPGNGWAIGGLGGEEDHILRTQSGGETWEDVTPPEPVGIGGEESGKSAIGFFLDTEMAWVTYENTGFFLEEPAVPVVWFTRDGGQTWEAGQGLEPRITSPSLVVPVPLQFVDPEYGWLMIFEEGGMMHQYVSLYKSEDGGENWKKILDPMTDTGGNLQSCCKTGMVFANRETGLVTHDQGAYDRIFIEWTYDGGSTWETQFLPPPDSQLDLFDDSFCEAGPPTFFNPDTVSFVLTCRFFSETETDQQFLYTTNDGGAIWRTNTYPGGTLFFLKTRSIGSTGTLSTPMMTEEPAYGWALGRDIYLTQDGGQTWDMIKNVNWDGQFSFVSTDLGWAVARSEEEIALVWTSDSGRNWKLLEPQIIP